MERNARSAENESRANRNGKCGAANPRKAQLSQTQKAVGLSAYNQKREGKRKRSWSEWFWEATADNVSNSTIHGRFIGS
jgi:hypothetical protein